MKINVPTLQKQSEMLGAILEETEPLAGAKRRVFSEIDLIIEYRNSLINAVVTGQVDVREAAVRAIDGEDLSDDTATDEEDMEDALDAVD